MIHNCLQVSVENDYYKEKIIELFNQNKLLKQNNEDLIKKLNETKSKKDTSCQTIDVIVEKKEIEHKPPLANSKCSVCKQNNNIQHKEKIDPDIYNKQNKKSYVKLCEMQHNLLKKYQEEVNSNAIKEYLINKMKIELEQYETKFKSYETELNDLRVKLDFYTDIESKQKSLLIDLETYKLKYQKYKEGLNCFDDNFFKEIEILKKKYDEAVKLNKYYEKRLNDKNSDQNFLENQVKKKKNRVKFNLDNMHDTKEKKMKQFADSLLNELSEIDLDLES